MANHSEARPLPSNRTQATLALTGLVLWAAHQMGDFLMIQLFCGSWLPSAIYAFTAVLAVVTLAAGIMSWRHFRSATIRDGDARVQRSQFLALTSVVLNAYFLGVILLEGAPVILETTCR